MMLVLGLAVAIAVGGFLAVALNGRLSNTVRAQVHVDDLFISAEALRHYNAAVSLARRTTSVLVVLVLGAVGGLVLLDPPSTVPVVVLAALGGLAVVVLLGANIVAPLRWVDLRLDGSGRWVTIERCHPAFARAVRQSYQDRDPSFR